LKPVKLYTKTYCPYCDRAKALLTAREIPYTEENIEGKPEEAKALFAKTGFRTVPQIFIGEECIGGFTELAALDASQKLIEKLKAD
jgi:GrxC family glutaredoxin